MGGAPYCMALVTGRPAERTKIIINTNGHFSHPSDRATIWHRLMPMMAHHRQRTSTTSTNPEFVSSFIGGGGMKEET